MKIRVVGPIVFVLLSVVCLVTYQVIGSEVAADGTLIEPFALIPIGYLLLMVGIVWGLISCLIWLFKRKKRG